MYTHIYIYTYIHIHIHTSMYYMLFWLRAGVGSQPLDTGQPEIILLDYKNDKFDTILLDYITRLYYSLNYEKERERKRLEYHAKKKNVV